MKHIFINIIWVFLSGLYTCLWGAFKDSPYEGFKPKTFPRSILFSAIILCILLVLRKSDVLEAPATVIFFWVMGLERFSSEIYKGFFRVEDQSKYFIPSRMSFFGRFVQSEFLRYGVGLFLLGLILLLQSLDMQVTLFWQFALISYLTGLSVAFGGAYKDAPFEGFDWIKFQRSGLVLLICAPLFYMMGPLSLGMLVFMNIGLERFLVEYYKTYIQRNMSGKFLPDTKRIQKHLDSREVFHYAALIIIVLVGGMYLYDLKVF